MTASHPLAGKVPFAIESPYRIPKERYYDQKFYELENERFWPRVWQMAARLEEIPNPGDYVEYEILDQSVIIVRLDANRIKAYHNACRHRGVQLVKDRGNAKQGFSCPFHGWRFNLEGENTFLYQPDLFAETERDKADLRLRECRVETWGGCAFINFDDNAPPLKESLEPFASYCEVRGAEDLRTIWWYSIIVPANWKLTLEAFVEGYHVMRTHPQLLPPSFDTGPNAVYRNLSQKSGTLNANPALKLGAAKSSMDLVNDQIFYMKHRYEGMGGVPQPRDIQIAEQLRDRIKLPEDPAKGFEEWTNQLNRALTEENRKAGVPMPDQAELAKSIEMNPILGFPNTMMLPVMSGSTQYRFRPLGPETTLYEIWSLGLYPKGEEPPPPKTPIPMAGDDPRWPWIPPQDFSNIPRQQKGLHSQSFKFMRLSKEVEGQISKLHQVLDGYLAGADSRTLIPGVQRTNGASDRPVETIGIGMTKAA